MRRSRRCCANTNARDCEGVASKSYRAPVLLVTGDGAHAAFPDRRSLVAGFRAYLEGEEKAGWISSKISNLEVRRLSAGVALAFVDYDKKKKDGEARDGWTYLLQKHGGAWRAVCVAPRDI